MTNSTIGGSGAPPIAKRVDLAVGPDVPQPVEKVAHDGFKSMVRASVNPEARARAGQSPLERLQASATPASELAAAALAVEGAGRESAFHYALLLASRGVDGAVVQSLASVAHFCSMAWLPAEDRVRQLRPFVERIAAHTEDSTRSALAQAALAVEGDSRTVASALGAAATVASRQAHGSLRSALIAAAVEAEYLAGRTPDAGATFRAAAEPLPLDPEPEKVPFKAYVIELSPTPQAFWTRWFKKWF